MGLPQSVKVAAGGVDNSCMCLGAACTHDGDAYTSLGSSAWIAVSSYEPIVNAAKRTYVFAHCIPGMFTSPPAFLGRQQLPLVQKHLLPAPGKRAEAQGKDVYDLLTAIASQSPAGSRKIVFNPSLAGGSGLDKSTYVRAATPAWCWAPPRATWCAPRSRAFA